MRSAGGPIFVAGAGAFGTALAISAARAGRKVTLWARDPARAAELAAARENRRHLPRAMFPELLAVTAERAEAVAANLAIFAVPSQATAVVAAALGPHLPEGVVMLAAAKGIEAGTGHWQTEVLADACPEARTAVLSGPGFAADIARGLPTAMTVAADDLSVAEAVAAALSGDGLRLYAGDDPIGVQLGGAAKNVVAIACGVAAGLGLGESARAALVARGLAEIARLGAAIGARPKTFAGLSGLGDLVLTATSEQSRNLRYGQALAAGRRPAELAGAGQPLAEGAATAGALATLARAHGVEMPIAFEVAALVGGETTVAEAMDRLVSRPLRRETG